MRWVLASALVGLVLSGLGAAQAKKPVKPTPEAHIGAGVKLIQQQLFEAASHEFEEALALDATNRSARFYYAVCLIAVGRNDEARQHFEKVHHKGDTSGEERYVTYYLGRLDLLDGDYPSAIEKLLSVVENPPFPDAALYLGEAYVSNGDLASGMKWMEQAEKLTPSNYRIHYRLARAYSSAGREEDAAREYGLYTHFQDDHRNTEAQARGCASALHRETPDKIREACYKMFDPNDPEKLTLLGQLLGDGGAYDLAIEPLQRAVALDPGSFDAWHDLGLTYFRLQRYAEARAPLEKAVALRPEFYGSVVLLGATLYTLGDDEAALPVLEHAHRLNPNDAQTNEVLEKLRAEKQKK